MPWKKHSRSEIVHVVVTGYQKKIDPRKHYVFVIDITWNNSDRYEIYRRYSDIFSFQTTLKALFPAAAGRRTDTRIIPQLPKRIFVGRSHVAKVAEARLEQINRYCQTLISLEPKFSESVHVIGFFSPRIGDKQLPKLHLHRPASLHPQSVPAGSVFEEYCALAEFMAEDESQISFKAGDLVTVLSKDESGWWMCTVDGGRVGWAPPSYLKKCDKSADSDDEYLGLPEKYSSSKDKDSDDSGLDDHEAEMSGTRSISRNTFKVPKIDVEEYQAIDSYEADGAGQISLQEGCTIHVLDKMEDGWWLVSNGTDEGWAPCSYLENMNGTEEDEEKEISSLDVLKYSSVEAYKAVEDDELSFPKYVIIDVLQKRLDGWWVIKYDSKIGLAPATYLKKEDFNTRNDPSSPHKPTPTNVTYQPEFEIRYQQPPRKQSVRYRASLKNKILTVNDSSTTVIAHSAVPTPSTGSNESPKNLPIPPKLSHDYTSPISSDSESESQKRAVSPKSPRSVKKTFLCRIRKFERQESESSSFSEDSSISLNAQKQESPPRKTSNPKFPTGIHSPMTPKYHSMDKTKDKSKTRNKPLPLSRFQSLDTANENSTQKDIPEIMEHLLEDNCSPPYRPTRPSGSEIRRAKERSRSECASPNKMSALTDDDVDSDVSSIISVSSRSSKESSTSSRIPQYRKQKLGQTQSVGEVLSPSLVPQPVPRKRNISVNNELRNTIAPPLSPPPERPQSSGSPERPRSTNNLLNQQMADTLIKYILASDDPGLKSALRDIIVSDPDVLKAVGTDIKEENSVPPAQTSPKPAPRNFYNALGNGFPSNIVKNVEGENTPPKLP